MLRKSCQKENRYYQLCVLEPNSRRIQRRRRLATFSAVNVVFFMYTLKLRNLWVSSLQNITLSNRTHWFYYRIIILSAAATGPFGIRSQSPDIFRLSVHLSCPILTGYSPSLSITLTAWMPVEMRVLYASDLPLISPGKWNLYWYWTRSKQAFHMSLAGLWGDAFHNRCYYCWILAVVDPSHDFLSKCVYRIVNYALLLLGSAILDLTICTSLCIFHIQGGPRRMGLHGYCMDNAVWRTLYSM